VVVVGNYRNELFEQRLLVAELQGLVIEELAEVAQLLG